jgi:hypothetical protein
MVFLCVSKVIKSRHVNYRIITEVDLAKVEDALEAGEYKIVPMSTTELKLKSSLVNKFRLW